MLKAARGSDVSAREPEEPGCPSLWYGRAFHQAVHPVADGWQKPMCRSVRLEDLGISQKNKRSAPTPKSRDTQPKGHRRAREPGARTQERTRIAARESMVPHSGTPIPKKPVARERNPRSNV